MSQLVFKLKVANSLKFLSPKTLKKSKNSSRTALKYEIISE